MPRNRKYVVTLERTTVDRKTLVVEAPTFAVAESRAYAAAETAPAWTEETEDTRVLGLKLQE